MAAILAADAPSSRRIVTGPITISGRVAAFAVGGSGAEASTTMAADPTASVGSGTPLTTMRKMLLVMAGHLKELMDMLRVE